MTWKRSLGGVLVGLALVLEVVSGIGLVDALGDDRGDGGPAAAAETDAGDTAASDQVEQADPVDTPHPVEEFVTRFAEAVRSGDHGFLIDRLHPAVFDRYGASQCEAYIPIVINTDLRLLVRDASEPGPYVWETDGVSGDVAAAYTVVVARIELGETVIQEIHLARSDGELRWFTDCGVPRSAGGGA